MQRVNWQILSWPLLTALVSPVVAQEVEVKGAQAILQPKTITVEIVTIENRRNSPLMAWEIGLYDRRTKALGMATSSDFTWQVVHPSSTSGPIKPNERRAIEMNIGDRDLGSPTIRLAVFEDGYIEGLPDVIDRWQKQRHERVDDTAYWIRAFETMPAGSEETAKWHLTARAAERTAQAPRDPSGIRGRLTRIWHESPQPPGWLSAVLEPIRREAQRQHAALTRRPATPPSFEAASPVAVSSQRATLTEFVTSVKNFREVSIEAFGIEMFEPGETRPRGGVSTDFCPIDPSAPGRGNGLIAPGESRELRFGTPVRDSARLPIVRMAFVMFDDLVFEGPAARRDTLLLSRERQADGIAFANAVRAEAAARPAGEALAFLDKKRAERITQLYEQGREPDVRLLDDLINEAKVSPERLRENVAVVKELERQRQRLLRHLKR